MSESYREVTLADVCHFIVDSEHKTAPTQGDGYPLIRTPNIGRGRFVLEGVQRVSQETFKAWTKRGIPRPGDLILAREAPVGNVALVQPGMRVCLGQRTVLIRPNQKAIDSSYLTYLLLGDEIQGHFHSVANGATVHHLNLKDLRALKLSNLPPLATQRKIAAILSAYDDLIENNTRRVRVLEDMARALYREWFVEFRFPGHEDSAFVEDEHGRRPEGWERPTLGQRVELLYGKALTASQRKPGPYPVYGSGGVVGNHLLPLSDGPGLIVGRKGNVGAIYWSDGPFFPIDTVYYVRSELPLHYLYFNLQSQNFINNDAAVPGLNRNQAYSLPLLVPDLLMLEQFTKLIDMVFGQLNNLRLRNANLRRTRDLLLPRLVSGELDVSALDVRGPALDAQAEQELAEAAVA